MGLRGILQAFQGISGAYQGCFWESWNISEAVMSVEWGFRGFQRYSKVFQRKKGVSGAFTSFNRLQWRFRAVLGLPEGLKVVSGSFEGFQGNSMMRDMI